MKSLVHTEELSRSVPLEQNLGWGVLPYMGCIGICGSIGYSFLAILVINRVSILAILIINRVWFLQSSLKLGTFFRRSYFFIIIEKTDQQKPFTMSLTSV